MCCSRRAGAGGRASPQLAAAHTTALAAAHAAAHAAALATAHTAAFAATALAASALAAVHAAALAAALATALAHAHAPASAAAPVASDALADALGRTSRAVFVCCSLLRPFRVLLWLWSPSTWWPAGVHRVQHNRQESTSDKLGPVCRWLHTCYVWYV